MAGKREETNRFTINGIDYVGTNPGAVWVSPLGASGQLLGVEAVREYNVLQHTYGAEYGKRAGGQINIVTSSGTNQLHGDLFEYLRNSALDARNFFDATERVPPFKRNQFGGVLGGPLKKDKLFLFGNYEGFRQRLAYSNVAIVPDAQARQGFLPCYLVYPTNTASACPDRGAYALGRTEPGGTIQKGCAREAGLPDGKILCNASSLSEVLRQCRSWILAQSPSRSTFDRAV